MPAKFINGKPIEPVEGGLEIAPEDQYLPPPTEEKIEAPEIGIIKELDPQKTINHIRNSMLGRLWDDNKKEYVKSSEAIMNEEGVGFYITILNPVVSSLTTFSNYSEQEVLELCNYVCEQAIPTIYVNYQQFGIKDKCMLPIVSLQVLVYTFSALKKAMGSGERNLLRGVLSEQIRSGMTPPPREERKSVWGRLSPFGRK